MKKTIDINWKAQTKDHLKILALLGFTPPKKVKRSSILQHTNLKKKGVPIRLRRNIFCGCCKSITTEYVTSYVPKALVTQRRDDITDSIRTCNQCDRVLINMSKKELIEKIKFASRNYNL